MGIEDFQDVTKIVFKKRGPKPQTWRRWFTVNAPGDVQRLLAGIRLEPFGSALPGCIREMLASFQTASGGFDVDFCMACFGQYHMSEEFYAEFQRLARRHSRSTNTTAGPSALTPSPWRSAKNRAPSRKCMNPT